jgi:hypothetical protein
MAPGEKLPVCKYKNVAKRPDANKGGREEEENRPGISS